MKVLVTGGAGYIGSVATEMLVGAGHEVLVFDNLQQGHRAAVDPAAAFVEGDLADYPAIDGAIGGFSPDAVMHFAANSLVGESMKDPFAYIGDNVVNALNLLKAMESSYHPGRRVRTRSPPDHPFIDSESLRRAGEDADHRGRADHSRQSLWRVEGNHRAVPALAVRDAGSALCVPPLLQRRGRDRVAG